VGVDCTGAARKKASPGAADAQPAGNPDGAEEYKQRGIVHLQMRNLSAGRADLETYLRLAPEAGDRTEIEGHLRAVRDLLAGLN